MMVRLLRVQCISLPMRIQRMQAGHRFEKLILRHGSLLSGHRAGHGSKCVRFQRQRTAMFMSVIGILLVLRLDRF